MSGGREAFAIQEVRQQDHQSARSAAPEVPAQRGLQARPPGGRERLEKPEHGPGLRLAPAHGQLARDAVRPGNDAHAIVIEQRKVGERGGDAAREVELRGFAEAHRCTRIDEQVHGQVGLFLEQTQDEAIEPQVDAPVEVTGVVARRVGPIVAEHHAAAGAPRPVHPAQMPRHRPARRETQVLKAAEEVFGEEVGSGLHGLDQRKTLSTRRTRRSTQEHQGPGSASRTSRRLAATDGKRVRSRAFLRAASCPSCRAVPDLASAFRQAPARLSGSGSHRYPPGPLRLRS